VEGTVSGSLSGKVAVVIGGHSGFGESISETCAHEGATVAIAARRRDLVDEVAARVGGSGHTCDITDDDQVQALVAAVTAQHGTIDIAVNCAGFEQSTPLRTLTPERLAAMHDVQLTGAIYCMRHFGNAMADGGRGGAFVSISSQTAHTPTIGLTAYASAKAAIEYATKIAAVEYGPQGVRFNVVAAGLIETPMTARIFTIPTAVQAMIELTPLGRMGSPQDVANAVLYLAGPLGSYVTGAVVPVDGGGSLLTLPTPQMFADVGARMAAKPVT
jgi:NAD(P)-dependent dehydrogenase (short-subunit alcohol dehydrogenase family)